MAFELIFLAAAALSGGVSVNESMKARKASRRAAQSNRRAENMQARRERGQQIREAYIQRGSVIQQTENQGIASSSASKGAVAGVSSQLAGNLSFLDRYNGEISRGNVYRDAAMKYAGNSEMWGGISDLAMTGAKIAPRVQQLLANQDKKNTGS